MVGQTRHPKLLYQRSWDVDLSIRGESGSTFRALRITELCRKVSYHKLFAKNPISAASA